MINTQINEYTPDTSLTQVASYFTIVDNAIKTGDTNKRYNFSSVASTAAAPPIKAGSWCHFTISPVHDNMLDLYNSFIRLKMIIPITNSTTVAAAESGYNPYCYWIGFKDSMDVVEQYQIVANGTNIYTQSNATEESFITSLATTDGVKSSDIFSKAKFNDVWKGKDTCLTGAYVKNGVTSVEINLKLDLRRFLPLSGIRYLPAFIGNLQLRVKLGTQGLVCAPVGPEFISKFPTKAMMAITASNAVTPKFVPVGETFKMFNAYTNSALVAADQTVTVGAYEFPTAESMLACFSIDDNLYQGLVQHYTSESLSFPIQTLSFYAMSGAINKNGASDISINVTPRFVDTIFILFPYKQNYHTCFDNPLMETFRLNMGGYGVFPDSDFTSYSAEMYEIASNAFNTNNDLTGFNKDVMRSLVNSNKVTTGNTPNDVSNYVFALPTSVDNTFQQGQTSNTPINYNLKITSLNSNSPLKDSASSCTPLFATLKDSVFAIQLREAGPPLVAIDEYDISSPAN